MATPRALEPAANRPTYIESAANGCSSDFRPPEHKPTLDQTDNGPQYYTNTPTASRPLNPNADSWPCVDLKPPVKLSSSRTVKEEPPQDKPGPPDTFLERLLATQSQQNSVMQQLLQQQQESTLALTFPQPEMPTFSRDPIEY